MMFFFVTERGDRRGMTPGLDKCLILPSGEVRGVRRGDSGLYSDLFLDKLTHLTIVQVFFRLQFYRS